MNLIDATPAPERARLAQMAEAERDSLTKEVLAFTPAAGSPHWPYDCQYVAERRRTLLDLFALALRSAEVDTSQEGTS